MRIVEIALAGIEGVLDRIAQTALFIMMLYIAWDSAGRYFFSSPAPASYEIVEMYLMVAVIFFTLAGNQAYGSNVRVDILAKRLPKRVRSILEFVYLLAAAIVFALIVWMSGKMALSHFINNRWTSGAVELPTGPSWSITAIGCAALSLRLALQAAALACGRELYRQDDRDTELQIN